jgi:hypothetical protein
MEEMEELEVVVAEKGRGDLMCWQGEEVKFGR